MTDGRYGNSNRIRLLFVQKLAVIHIGLCIKTLGDRLDPGFVLICHAHEAHIGNIAIYSGMIYPHTANAYYGRFYHHSLFTSVVKITKSELLTVVAGSP
jgi:hypothetical protein